MAWGFAQLEGCILIYSNWNGKTKVIRTFLDTLKLLGSRHSLAPRSSLLTPNQVPKGRGEREKEAEMWVVPFLLSLTCSDSPFKS